MMCTTVPILDEMIWFWLFSVFFFSIQFNSIQFNSIQTLFHICGQMAKLQEILHYVKHIK